MLRLLGVVILSALSTAQSSPCKWSEFFSKSKNMCTTDTGAGPVDCSKLKDSGYTISIDCDSGRQLLGYKRYNCINGEIVPKVYSSTCASTDTPTCPIPRGKDSDNIVLVRDAKYSFNALPIGQELHVKCKPGFLFRSSVKDSVLAKCVVKQNGKSMFQITTESAEDGCLPACPVQDKDQLPQNIEHLDRITIVYPSDRKEVADGSQLFAKVLCQGGYSPVNLPSDNVIALSCTSKGQNGINSGYFVQKCEDETKCFSCATNCEVPKVEGGTVYRRDGKYLRQGGSSIPTGDKTAYVQCSDGYDVMGNRYLSCDEGVINSTIPTCSGEKACSPKVVPNGLALPDKSFTTSTEYTVECNKGYALASNSARSIKCNMDPNSLEVEYSEIPACYLGCQVPKIKNGRVEEVKQLPVDGAPYSTNETVNVVCDGDFLPMGETTINCGVRGWENMPQCVTEEEMANLGAVKDDKENNAISLTGGFLVISTLMMTILL